MYSSSGRLNKKRPKTKTSGQGKSGEGACVPKRGPGRGLPVELVEKILSFCNRADLLKCCLVSKSLYQLVLPLIYQTYDPTIWPDVVRLERQLVRGMGPSCFDSKALSATVASKIRSIDLRFGKSSVSHREQQWAMQETIRSLSRIIPKTQHLRSLTWHSEAFQEDMTALWKALGNSEIEKLALSDGWPKANASLYGPSSKLWTLSNLSKLHLTLLWSPSHPPLYLMPGLIKLLTKTPTLTDLKVNVQGLPEMHLPVGEICCENFFKIKSLSNLRSLDLENILCSDGLKTVQFLATLPKLEKLRWAREHIRQEHDLFHGPGREFPSSTSPTSDRAPLLLPSLREVDVTELGLLRSIFQHNTPVVARNVLLTCSSGIPESRQPSDLSFLHQCSSLEEVHLSIYGHTHMEEYRDATVACLQSIPTSVRRLAIRMPSHLSQIKLTHTSPSKDYLEALRRLDNLEYLILPWTAILYKTDKQTGSHHDDLSRSVEDRAKFIARKAAEKVPTLRFVFFQGSYSINATGDSSWEPNFDETDDDDRRFCVKITRDVASVKMPWKKGFLKTASASGKGGKKESASVGKIAKVEEDTEAGSSGSKNGSNEVAIKVEMILSTCVCRNCWLVEKGESFNPRQEDPMELMLETMMPMMPFGGFSIEL